MLQIETVGEINIHEIKVARSLYQSVNAALNQDAEAWVKELIGLVAGGDLNLRDAEALIRRLSEIEKGIVRYVCREILRERTFLEDEYPQGGAVIMERFLQFAAIIY